MRAWTAVLLLLLSLLSLPAACHVDEPPTNWTCDYDASESRPTADRDAAPIDDAGHLAPGECQATCGAPVSACTATTLEGGVPGAVCPVCTF